MLQVPVPNGVKRNDGEKLLLVTSECNNFEAERRQPNSSYMYALGHQTSLAFKIQIANFFCGQIPKAAEMYIVKNTLMEII